MTTKRLSFKTILRELLWFIAGQTNIEWLKAHNVHIWNEWADDDGELGPIYGKQWRFWEDTQGNEIDQLQSVITAIREDPNSRRHFVSAWNVADLPEMNLAPCHTHFQFYVANDRLSCHLYQRSADVFLGVPFNIASYSLLLSMVAQITDYAVGDFIHSFGDAHLYVNHIEQAEIQLEREPKPLPTLVLDPSVREIDDFKEEHVAIRDYVAHPHIKGAIAV